MPSSLPDWSRSELILALDMYLATRATATRSYSPSTPAVRALSANLRRLREFPEDIRSDPRFRNPAGSG